MDLNRTKIWRKRNIIILLIFIFACIYVSAYIYQYNHVKKPIVKYIEKGKTFDYQGGQVLLHAKICTIEELVEEFSLDEEYLLLGENEMFVLINADIKKNAAGDLSMVSNSELVVETIHTGKAMEIENAINKSSENRYDASELNELKIGEEAHIYMVRGVSKLSMTEKLWKNRYNLTYYLEFEDYEGREYFTRVKLIN